MTFSVIGVLNAEPRLCEYCQKPIPFNRNQGSKHCSESHKTLAYLARKKEQKLIGNIKEEVANPKCQNEHGTSSSSSKCMDEMEPPLVIQEDCSSIETKPMPVLSTARDSSISVLKEMQSQKPKEDTSNSLATNNKQLWKIWSRVTMQIERIVWEHIDRKEYEIAVNRIHSILPESVDIEEADVIKLPDFTLRYSANRNHYLITKKLKT